MSCTATMESMAVAGHTHTCTGNHDPMDGSHWCSECRRWWWSAP